MPKVPEEIIQDIKSRARIEDVIGHYIEVIRKGTNYVCVCPFHNDSDPSLHINVEKQIFKCFSCPGEEKSAGDVFRFVSKYKKIGYLDAVKEVAGLINYDYDFGESSPKNDFEETPLHKVLEEAVAFCQYELSTEDGKPFMDYLAKRGIDHKLIEKYQFGANPKGNVLCRYLSSKGYQDKDIVAANLGRITSKGIVDVFSDRLMIPIYDNYGHPIGFTARSLNPHADSKYINTAETPLFVKGDIIFNYHRAKEGVKERKYVLLSEGPMDVIGFNRAGLSNAVCTMGTACTERQLLQIQRLSNNLVLAYDGDKAGQGAIFRTGKMAKKLGFNVKVIANTTQYDPDEIINKYGKDTLVSMVEKPFSWLDFFIDYKAKQANLENLSEKKEFAKAALEEINTLTEDFDRAYYLEKLSKLTGFSIELLTGRRSGNNKKVIVNNKPVSTLTVKTNGLIRAQKGIIKAMLTSNDNVEYYKKTLYGLPDRDYNTLAIYIIDYFTKYDEMDLELFKQSLLEEDSLDKNEVDRYCMMCDSILHEVSLPNYNEVAAMDGDIKKIMDNQLKEKQVSKMNSINQYNDPLMVSKELEQYKDISLARKQLLEKQKR